MADEPKQGDVIPAKQAQPVALDELLRAATPLMDKWSETAIATAEEETKRLKLELDAEDRRDARLTSKDKAVFLSAFGIYVVVLVFGMLKGDTAFVWSALTGFASFAGGYGFGRHERQQSTE